MSVSFGADAILLLRRLDSGDESAWADIAPFLKRLDAENAATEKWIAEVEARHAKRDKDNEARRKRSRLGSGKFEIAPAHEGGCDHGSAGIVLLKNKTHRLVWRGGCKYWSGVGQSSYAPADLSIMLPRGSGGTGDEHLTDNHAKSLRSQDYSATSRLSAKVVLMFAKQIDAVFGRGSAARAAKLEGTVVTVVTGRVPR